MPPRRSHPATDSILPGRWPLAALLVALAATDLLAQSSGSGVLSDLSKSIESSLSQGSGAYVLGLAFLAGFISSFTPCVYPLIPITLSIFGATGDIPRVKAFLLSLCYVGGIAVTYTILGIFSAKTGFIFGAFLGNPIVVGLLCLALFVLALYTLEVFHFSFATNIQNKASQVGGKGFFGAFLMGSVSGLVAAPCIGPVLIVILGYVAASKDAVWGGAILFSYSIGLGIIFILLGTFSGLVKKLPKSGNWLHGVKFSMGVALLMVAVFLLDSFVSAPLDVNQHLPIILVLILSGVALAFLAYRKDLKSLRVISALIVSVALYEVIVPNQANHGLNWLSSIEAAVQEASSRGTPIMLDLYADWCAACKELEAHTFSKPGVIQKLQGFAIARVDFTSDTPLTQAISEKYGIIGLPSVLFLGKDGAEIADTRVTQFVEAGPFEEHLSKVLAVAK